MVKYKAECCGTGGAEERQQASISMYGRYWQQSLQWQQQTHTNLKTNILWRSVEQWQPWQRHKTAQHIQAAGFGGAASTTVLWRHSTETVLCDRKKSESGIFSDV